MITGSGCRLKTDTGSESPAKPARPSFSEVVACSDNSLIIPPICDYRRLLSVAGEEPRDQPRAWLSRRVSRFARPVLFRGFNRASMSSVIHRVIRQECLVNGNVPNRSSRASPHTRALSASLAVRRFTAASQESLRGSSRIIGRDSMRGNEPRQRRRAMMHVIVTC